LFFPIILSFYPLKSLLLFYRNTRTDQQHLGCKLTVPQLFNQLTNALDDASSSLQSMQSPAHARRQSDSDIAQLVAGIISVSASSISITTRSSILLKDIGNALNGLESVASAIPDLDILLGGVDASLNQVLHGLSLLQGVLTLVANL
jgi:hypothetical protein